MKKSTPESNDIVVEKQFCGVRFAFLHVHLVPSKLLVTACDLEKSMVMLKNYLVVKVACDLDKVLGDAQREVDVTFTVPQRIWPMLSQFFPNLINRV